jgi:hypothetical protein
VLLYTKVIILIKHPCILEALINTHGALNNYEIYSSTLDIFNCFWWAIGKNKYTLLKDTNKVNKHIPDQDEIEDDWCRNLAEINRKIKAPHLLGSLSPLVKNKGVKALMNPVSAMHGSKCQNW